MANFSGNSQKPVIFCQFWDYYFFTVMKDIIHRCVVYKGSVFIVCLTIMKGIYAINYILNSQPFLNTTIRPDIIFFGMRLSLLIETLTGTLTRVL